MEYSKCWINDVNDKDDAGGGGLVEQSSYRNSVISVIPEHRFFSIDSDLGRIRQSGV